VAWRQEAVVGAAVLDACSIELLRGERGTVTVRRIALASQVG
jgi:hypothetical protein